ncbi:single-stranded DNA-binding protein [Rhodopseudomonas sp. BR0G17]|uniref:single-stranded DNA-binding protein n=1 Tax=Rhodopseudomonas sp. BR0G17 TaxID=2269368 RepID=UPI0013E0A5C4|nr:single-stranded DNA-binding protein [Rhodopseudomonas sp. BR0G17]NEW96619.1 single-stranded DNA-binding protein [Rhodopseudomonas sp. BR0G17]
MAGSVNKVILIGNLGTDPDIRHTQDGRPIATFSIATSETWRDRTTGERKEATEWHRVVVFNENLAKIAEQYLKKGSKVYVEGAQKTRKWTDQGGVDRYTTEVVLQSFNSTLTLLDKREGVPGAQGEGDYGTTRTTAPASGGTLPPRGSGGISSGRASPPLDDDIPF